MGIIDGRTQAAEATPVKVRVVAKIAERAIQPEAAERNSTTNAAVASKALLPHLDFARYLDADQHIAARSGPLSRYVSIEADSAEHAQELVRELQESGAFEEAYVEGGPTPPPVNPTQNPRFANQGYLEAAPTGIDARWTWSLADGSGIGFVDVEQGWTLNHEDLVGANITLSSGVNQAYTGHGTAVLGEVLMVDNTIGGVGIAPGASGQVVSQYRTPTNYNTAAAILAAEQIMSPGDVMLLEMQTGFNGLSNLPVEVEPAVFDAIRHAVDSGIVVVEAGGNGANDLDAYNDPAPGRGHVLNRNHADFRDSGAIMVGAASSTAPHSRLSFSCFGSRIDCYGWGENIDTTGDGWQGNTTTAYTTGFGGTSGASPIVAGSALLLQSWRRSSRGRTYDPDTVRELLSGAGNTDSNDPGQDKIGRMPNLRAVIEQQIADERFQIDVRQFFEIVYILSGIINDAPGWIWVPGKGPVPIDPGWGREGLIPAYRDLLAGFLINQLALHVEDEVTREGLQANAVTVMQKSVNALSG